MKAVSVALFSLAASAMAMPPHQKRQQGLEVTDDQWSQLWEGCSKNVTNAREACKTGTDQTIDCDKASHMAGTQCIVDASRPKLLSDDRHKECKDLAVQGVEDCMNAKDNTKTVPQCQRVQLDSYTRCTISGPSRPMTPQDTEYSDIWSNNCSKQSREAYEECNKEKFDESGNKVYDFGNKCEHERNDKDMQCLLDNIKGRSKDSFVHGACSASAISNVNDCFYHNNKGKTLPQCQREQWDAYPDCVKKHAPQETVKTEAAAASDAAPKPESCV